MDLGTELGLTKCRYGDYFLVLFMHSEFRSDLSTFFFIWLQKQMCNNENFDLCPVASNHLYLQLLLTTERPLLVIQCLGWWMLLILGREFWIQPVLPRQNRNCASVAINFAPVAEFCLFRKQLHLMKRNVQESSSILFLNFTCWLGSMQVSIPVHANKKCSIFTSQYVSTMHQWWCISPIPR